MTVVMSHLPCDSGQQSSVAGLYLFQESPLTHPEPVAVDVVGSYLGEFARLRDGLRAFLVSEGIINAPSDELLNSLLATAESNSGVDWQTRENLQARMKVGLRRVLRKERIDSIKVAEASERLLTWLKASSPLSTNTSSL
jgi:hypothetical protein